MKINLNKRIAFPLTTSATTNVHSQAPLLLPPKIKIELNENHTPEKSNSNDEEIDFFKGKVLSILEKSLKEINCLNMQETVSTKVKTLEDDWKNCDLETKKLLIELTDCEFLKIFKMNVMTMSYFLDLEKHDTTNAFIVHRKIAMKGFSDPWLHAIRQILMNKETSKDS